jgi:uracil-DNA glycosylase
MSVLFENDWNDILKDEFEKEYYQTLRKKLIEEYRTTAVYPDMYDIFNALHLTSFADTKVVIIGQDPYHNKGQAHGLCFSVKPMSKCRRPCKTFTKNCTTISAAQFRITVIS